ncbi:HAMP domain-containing histidine kinase [Dysgonomonas sp. Marseille-P4677]|uniref:HAMP domain-containing sensor histidine kinase n=1 Tax=Dysgonomonas sp. Marseille-P4677 TaxID=2364790 RepID=UPI00191473E8|nr:HAMP domain-containing sensor histidine kinase [Dysgonomonas sp. Marseille-P4677]MBK5722234.1 HAMP domain-containing histidine kinase [Dysgonomonas sp. Marseille-P4677]
MKIRTKLTLQYVGATAVIFSLIVLSIYLFSEKNREQEFFRELKKEAVTKANLYLSKQADAQVMQSIYRNNREFLDEVEVAVYTKDFKLLYHDAQDIDIVKETPTLINSTIKNTELAFYENQYQAIAMVYHYSDSEYIITAAAYDGQGYTKLNNLIWLLFILWLSGLAVLAVLGYILAREALAPVSKIVNEVDLISESNLNTRLVAKNTYDELGELSETFNRMLDRLEQSFSSQKMFVSNVSHELRTPLSALIAELEVALLRDQRSNEEYKIVISNALNDAKELKKLTGGLLDLAKANYDATQVVIENLRLDELLLDARELVLKANKDYSVNLIFDQDVEDERLITVRGNDYLLKIAFSNLIENSCKFSDDKTSYIQISFYDEKAIIRFSDTGIGIDKEDIENLFIPFYRGKNSTHIKGQGIGMALVQKIIKLHKGTISVHSHIGEGTVVTIEIPHIIV